MSQSLPQLDSGDSLSQAVLGERRTPTQNVVNAASLSRNTTPSAGPQPGVLQPQALKTVQKSQEGGGGLFQSTGTLSQVGSGSERLSTSQSTVQSQNIAKSEEGSNKPEGEADAVANLLTGVGGAIVNAPGAAVEAALNKLNQAGGPQTAYGDSVANAANTVKTQVVNATSAVVDKLPDNHTKNADGSQRDAMAIASSVAGATASKVQTGAGQAASTLSAYLPGSTDEAMASLQQSLDKMQLGSADNAPSTGAGVTDRISAAVASAHQSISGAATSAVDFLPTFVGGGGKTLQDTKTEDSIQPASALGSKGSSSTKTATQQIEQAQYSRLGTSLDTTNAGTGLGEPL